MGNNKQAEPFKAYRIANRKAARRVGSLRQALQQRASGSQQLQPQALQGQAPDHN